MKLNLIGYSNPCFRLLPHHAATSMRYFSTKDEKEEIQDGSKQKNSPFSRRHRDYTHDEKEHIRKIMDVEPMEAFEPKKEYSRLKFDPNVRQTMDNIPNKLLYEAYLGY